ncbi:restriction endonuclease subunit S [Streptomyces yunnanensis]|uniref:Restriction endonuclease subunit S n=1 Tax=Streptomyces yunnanensis TaxID=156453 RepID=A0ABY8A8V6_9ACTN|nr:restriction endonuclease subunit S [Streptomyces yunnanensis]WEB41223.1 restriction endonuclease subunit S [Streptomyces yunnanensis]
MSRVQDRPEWRLMKLKDLLSEPLINGRSVVTRDDGFPVLRLTAIKPGGIDISEHKGGAWSRDQALPFLIKQRDFFVSRGNGSLDLVGRGAPVWESPIEVAFPDTMIRVRVRPDVISAAYLSRIWDSSYVRSQIERSVRTTSGIYKVNQRTLSEIKLWVPPLAHQSRISEVLDRVDDLRAKRREAIRLLGDLAQSIFIDMFGDPARNPLKWPMKKIGDLIDSASYGTSEKASEVGDLPVLRMGNITSSGRVDLSDLKFMDRASTDEKYLIRRGDVLFNRTNSAELVGKSAIYRGNDDLAFAGYLVRVRVNASNDPEYLAAFLNTQYAKRVLRGMSKSIVGMANINARELQGIEVAEPPLPLQVEFAKRVGAVESLREIHRRHLVELDSLFASLQDRAFRGELWPDASVPAI